MVGVLFFSILFYFSWNHSNSFAVEKPFSAQNPSAWHIGIIFWVPATSTSDVLQDQAYKEDLAKELKELKMLRETLVQKGLNLQLSILVQDESDLYASREKLIQFSNHFAKISQALEKQTQAPTRNALFFYGHGNGPTGLNKFPLHLAKTFIQNFPKTEKANYFEWVWFDSCFLATVEWAMEWGGITQNLVASEGPVFSSGSPYGFLELLALPLHTLLDTDSLLGLLLTESMASYSYRAKGSQRFGVESSPATLSWISLPRLKESLPWLKSFAEFIQKIEETPSLQRVSLALRPVLSRELVARNESSLSKKVNDLPSPEQIDVNRLLMHYWTFSDALVSSHSNDGLYSESEIYSLFSTLNTYYPRLSSVDPTLSDRYSVYVPIPAQTNATELRLVVGYEGFTRGDSQDSDWSKGFTQNAGLSPAMAEQVFRYQNKDWPVYHFDLSKAVLKDGIRYLRLTPFTPNTQLLQAFWISKNSSDSQRSEKTTFTPIGPVFSYSPSQDFVALHNSSPFAVVRYFGFTQSTNSLLPHWSGISILSPFAQEYSVDYFDLSFSQFSNWRPY